MSTTRGRAPHGSVMTENTSVNRVLIHQMGSLGDTIVALPCYHLIARAFPNSQRMLLTNTPHLQKAPSADAILGNSGLIHGYIQYDPAKRAALWRKAREIRRFKPDVVVYIMWIYRPEAQLRRDVRFFRLVAGVRRFIGVPHSIEPRLERMDQSGLYEPESHRLARMIEVLGDAAPDDLANWDLHLTKDENARGLEALGAFANKPLIACGPGTKMQAKDWGQDNWQTLMKRLSPEFPGYSLVMVGAKEDHSASEHVAKGWQGDTLNLCGVLTPRETAAALSKAELFLGPDSGPMHLAALNGVPCAIPFAARDYPGVWYPVGNIHRVIYHAVDCRHCRLATCVEQKKKCLTSISVDEMFKATLEAWRNGNNRAHPSMASATSATELES